MAKKELDRFDTNAKRDVQIKTKLIAMIVGAVLGCVAGTLVLTLIIFNNGLVGDTESGLDYTASGVDFSAVLGNASNAATPCFVW